MAFTDIVNIGDKINIKNDSNQNRKCKVYVSQVLDIMNSGEILISLPIEAARIVPLMIDIRYNLCFYTKVGLYQCDCILTKRYQINNMYVGEAQLTTPLEKCQRREFYRLDCLIDTKYAVLADINDALDLELDKSKQEESEYHNSNSEEMKAYSKLKKVYERLIGGKSDKVYDAVITNLSGGGARFKTDKIHQINDSLVIKILLPFSNREEKLYIKSHIIAVTRTENVRGYYEYRVVFEDISKFVREKIIRYIFDVERRKQYLNKRNG